MSYQTPDHDTSWMIEDVIDVPGVLHAVVLSADGLLKARTPDLSREAAETLAATAAGFQSLGAGAAKHFGDGPMKQHMTEWQGGFLFVRGAGNGSGLAVIADHSVDPGLIAFQMAKQVARFGEHLATPPRSR